VSARTRRILDLPPEGLDRLLAARRQTHEERIGPSPRRAAGGSFPLSFAQQRLWLLDQLIPGDPAYNVAAAFEIAGALDAAALGASFAAVVRRHEVLRSRIEARPGEPEPVQVVGEPFAPPLPAVDLRALAPAVREVEVRRLAAEEALRPFDLASGPLLRLALLCLGERRDVLLLTLHHIVSDGWSIEILIREMALLYRGHRRGRPAALPALPIQYADFADWQRRRDENLSRSLAHWRERLSGLIPLDLPTDRPRPPIRSSRGGQVFRDLPSETIAALEALAVARGATLFMALLGALAAVLARWAGQSDLVLGSPVANRDRGEIEGLIGFFANTVVLRLDLAGDPAFGELVRRARETALAAFAHQEVPFERLVEELNPVRERARTPLFTVAFALQEGTAEPPPLPELSLRPLALGSLTAKFDLTLTVAHGGAGWRAAAEYAADLFDAATARRLLEHWATLLRGAAADPGTKLSDLPLLTPAERHQAVVELAGSAVQGFPAGGLDERFAAWARRSPEAVALVAAEGALTYRELDRAANRLARRLRREGVGPEVPVGICLERGVRQVVAVLAVLKAGGAYVPLDPSSPDERLAAVLADCRAPVLVSEESLWQEGRRAAAGGARSVLLDVDGEAIAAESAEPLAALAVPESLAYVIYTSGSTGRPKGVPVCHGNVTRLLAAAAPLLGCGPGDAWSLFHSYAFDFAVWELWGALARGGRLVVVPYWVSRSPEAFWRLLDEERVTVLNQTPSAFRQLLAALLEAAPEGSGPGALRCVVFGGEALDAAALAPWFERFGGGAPRLINMYGITETTVHVTFRPVVPEDAGPSSGSPIGGPLPDLRLHLLDAAGAPVPLGVAGEIFVGGPGLARGYLGRPELTAQRFVPDRFSGLPGERLYASGDLARRRPDGDLLYLGRRDHQVKIRGFRIELGDVETHLEACPGVRRAAVVARADGGGERRLVAYVVPAEPREDPEAFLREVRRWLAGRLPEPMVPAAFVAIPELPLSPTGKVDRRALPEPDLESAGRPAAEPPRTPLERELGRLFAAVLGRSAVGRRDSFFELGGHSLKATQLASRLRRELAIELELRELFDAPTVEGLATLLANRAPRALHSIAPATPRARYPLSHAQRRLWLLEQMSGPSALYVIPGAYRLDREVDPAVLERCLATAVSRHESLRTAFREVAGEPCQVVLPDRGFRLPVVDLRGEEEPTAAAERWAREEAARPFDLGQGRPFRARLLRLGEREHVLLLTLHHIVADGWSLQVLHHELSTLYEACSRGLPDPLPAPALQYRDFAVWEAERGFEREERFWRQQMSPLPEPLHLPFDFPASEVRGFAGGAESALLSRETTRRLRALAAAHGTTPSNVVLCVFAILLCRLTGQSDLAIAMSVANRHHPDLERIVGFFVNELVIRIEVPPDADLAEILGRVAASVYAALDHQGYPFDLLVEKLNPERRGSRQPLFNVCYAFQNLGDLGTAWGRPAAPGGTGVVGTLEAGWTTSKFDLTLFVVEEEGGDGGRYRLTFEYSAELFRAESIARWLQIFRRFLASAAEPAEAVAGAAAGPGRVAAGRERAGRS
jgi:amino acid adenylation domain-containing protein